MKKVIAILISALLIFSLIACSAKSHPADSAGYEIANSSSQSSKSDMDNGSSPAAPADYGVSEEMGSGSPSKSGLTAYIKSESSFSEKIIYSASANMETVTFEETLKELGELITEYEAFIENSYESGADYASSYFGYNPYRIANYTIRIPKDNFSKLTGALPQIGHVTSLSTNAENVTEHYTDIDSRLKVYRTEESRLLAMLEKADTVADMITIESTLSDVRYNIESLTSSLKNLDNRIDYSSVTIEIREVEELKRTDIPHRSYGQQIIDGFKNSLEDIGIFFMNLFKAFVVNLPILVILAAIVVVVAVLIKRIFRRSDRASKLFSKAVKDKEDSEE